MLNGAKKVDELDWNETVQTLENRKEENQM